MYLLTETVSPFALERWAAFFANFGQFAKGFLYTLGISIGALIVALLLDFWCYEFDSQQGTSWYFTCLCRNLPKYPFAGTIRSCLLWHFDFD